MKTIYSAFNGAIVVSEQAGDIFITFNGALGGGSTAGWLSANGSIKLGSGSVALKAAENLLNHLIPSAEEPIVLALEGVVNSAVSAL